MVLLDLVPRAKKQNHRHELNLPDVPLHHPHESVSISSNPTKRQVMCWVRPRDEFKRRPSVCQDFAISASVGREEGGTEQSPEPRSLSGSDFQESPLESNKQEPGALGGNARP